MITTKSIPINFPLHKRSTHSTSLFASPISAGPQSPADRTIDHNIDLNEFLIKNPTATFFVRVEGTSMIDAGIHPGDILIVDKSLDPSPNNFMITVAVAVAVVGGEFLVKRLITECGEKYLMARRTILILGGMRCGKGCWVKYGVWSCG
jgi:DNA polymerase V